MSLKLILDDPNRAYRPGSTVTGKVQYRNDVRPTQLILRGATKSKITTEENGIKASRRGRAPLLYQAFPLSPTGGQNNAGPTSPTNANAWEMMPFAIKIPERVSEVNDIPTPAGKERARMDYWNPESHWQESRMFPVKHQSGYLLPSTCKFGPRGVKTESECSIEYSITATDSASANVVVDMDDEQFGPQKDQKVNGANSGITKTSIKSVTHPIWLQMAAPGQAVDEFVKEKPRLMTFQTMSLLPGPASVRKPSFSQRLKSSVKTPQLPQAAFEVTLSPPKRIRIGAKIPMTIHIVPTKAAAERTGKQGQPVPLSDVDLTNVKIEILAQTGARVRAPLTHVMQEDSWNEKILVWEESTNAEGRPFLTRWLAEDLITPFNNSNKPPPTWIEWQQQPLGEQRIADLSRRITLPQPLPDRLAPTFSTYNIFRTYTWRIWLTFECEGDVRMHRYELPLTVLPSGQHEEASVRDCGAYSLKAEHVLLNQLYADMLVKTGDLAFQLLTNLL